MHQQFTLKAGVLSYHITLQKSLLCNMSCLSKGGGVLRAQVPAFFRSKSTYLFIQKKKINLMFFFFNVQICRKMGIIEVDYFGLQFTGTKGEILWINLRNRISQQVDCLSPCRLRLRVKFFVEPHLILQEQTRWNSTKVNISCNILS